jgi:hypothetical protein
MPGVLECAMKDRPDVRKEASWCIANFFSGGNNAQCLTLLNMEGMVPLFRMLEIADTSLADLSLDGIERSLKIGEKDPAIPNPFVAKIEEFEGEKTLARLAQKAGSEHIRDKIQRILDRWFPVWCLFSFIY